jgi:hypothetical protein
VSRESWIEWLYRGGYFGLPAREAVAVDAKIRLLKTLRRLSK